MSKWVLGAVTLAIIFAMVFFNGAAQPPVSFQAAQLLPTPQALTNFSLETDNAEPFTRASFQGHWSLVFFGFTSCPDFCPTELQKLGKVLQLSQQFAQTHGVAPIRVVFISLDPERDTAEKMKEYVNFFNPHIAAVRGANAELAKVAHSFASDYSRLVKKNDQVISVPAGVDLPDQAGNEYQVEHSARMYIVNPAAEYVGSFAPPHKVDAIWSDMQLISIK
jgi:protein SCO1